VNFALANNESAGGGFSPDLINRFTGGAAIDLNLEANRYYFIHGYAKGLAWMRSHPGDALRLLARKLNRWLDGLSNGFGVANLPGGLTGSRAPVDLFVPDRGILKWPLLALLVAGVAQAVVAAAGPPRQYKSSGSVDARGRLIQDAPVFLRPAR
jgi:hypothetical protein